MSENYLDLESLNGPVVRLSFREGDNGLPLLKMSFTSAAMQLKAEAGMYSEPLRGRLATWMERNLWDNYFPLCNYNLPHFSPDFRFSCGDSDFFMIRYGTLIFHSDDLPTFHEFFDREVKGYRRFWSGREMRQANMNQRIPLTKAMKKLLMTPFGYLASYETINRLHLVSLDTLYTLLRNAWSGGLNTLYIQDKITGQSMIDEGLWNGLKSKLEVPVNVV